MTERHKQLQAELSQSNLFQQSIVADYIFVKTLLFARNNLVEEEYRLFQRLFHILNATFPRPDLLVYLHRSVDNLLAHIRKRGRSYELEIAPEYLQQIQTAYFDFFKTNDNIPILIIDLDQIDFLHNREYYDKILEILHKPYHPGVHRVRVF